MSFVDLIKEVNARLSEFEDPDDIRDVLPLLFQLQETAKVGERRAVHFVYFDPVPNNKRIFEAIGAKWTRVFAVEVFDALGVGPDASVGGYETFYFLAKSATGESETLMTKKHARRMAVLLERIARLADDARPKTNTEANAGGAQSADTRADTSRKNLTRVPRNNDVLRLHQKLVKEADKGRSQIDIARDFTEGDAKKADSLLRAVRRFRKANQ